MVEVRLERVSKIFDGKVVAVKDVDLVIESGEFMVLLGPSGSGKSTILYMIAGIYKPTRGRILFDGKDVTDKPPMERNVGLVFQNYALYPHMKVYDNIAFPLRIRRVPEREIRERVRRVSEMLRISHLLDRYPWQLSGGQQQRVAIARALVKEPQVLLLDEPLSNLDALLRIHVRSELKRLQKKLGITTIHVTHDQSEAMAIADRVALINEGRVQQVGKPEEVYGEPVNTFVASFLGNPPMNLIEARLDPEEPIAYVAGGRVEISRELHRKAVLMGLEKVMLGFRPEGAKLVVESEWGIPGKIYTVEPLGRDLLVVVQVGGEGSEELVRLIAPPERYEALTALLESGSTVKVLPDPRRIKLFHPETGKSLTYLQPGS